MRVVPTAAGRVLLAVSGCALLAAWFGMGDAFGWVAALGLGLAAAAAIATWRRAGGLGADAPEPATAVAGKPVVLGVLVRNSGGAAARDVVLTLLRPGGGGRGARLSAFVPHVPPGGETFVEAAGPALRRGRHPQGVLEIETSAPLGLFSWRTRIPLPHDVLVLPRPVGVRPAEEVRAGVRPQEVQGARSRGDEQEYRALLDWRDGECVRRVHWKASARRARLLVREFEGEPRAPVHVVLSCALDRRTPRGRARFEDAVSFAAALASRGLREGRTVRVTLAGCDVRTLAPSRGAGPGAVLRALAEVEPAAPDACRPLASVPGLARRGETVWLVRAGPGDAAPPCARVLDVTDAATRKWIVRAPHRGFRRQPEGLDGSRLADVAPALRAAAWGSAAVSGVAATVALAATLSAARADGDPVRRAAFLAVVAASALVHLAFVLRRAHDDALHVRTLWTMAALALASVAIVGTGAAAVAVPLSVTILVAGLAFAHALRVRRRTERALEPDSVPDDEPDLVRRRAGGALLTAAHALVVALLLVPLTTWVIPRSTARTQVGERRGGNYRPDGAYVDPSAAGDPGLLARRLLLEAEPYRGTQRAGNLGPLYLRGIVAGRLGPDGLWTDDSPPPRRIADADDGALDGLCALGPAPGPDEDLTLVVRQAVLEHAVLGGSVLHVPGRASSVALPALLATGGAADAPGDATLVAPQSASGPLDGDRTDYRVVVALPALRTFASSAARTAEPDAAMLALPPSPLVDAFTADARAAASAATSDAERVRAIVAALRRDYRYDEIDDSLRGFAALAEFRRARKGTCSQFAEAAAVMLRGAGIPARVVTGFLVRRYDRDRGCYYALGADYHAWVEARFAETGWVTVDATPEDPAESPPDEEPGVLGSWLARLLASVRRNPVAWLAGVLLAASVGVLLARIARSRRAASDAAAAGAFVAPPAWNRILALLAARGFVRAPSQTALEFAAGVATIEPPLAGFVDVTRREQSARYGARPLTDADLAAIEAFLALAAALPRV